MIGLIAAIHIFVCIALVIIVLIQRGKGADIGAVFGGASQTMFGARGQGNVLTRATTALAVAFFATSIYLAYSSTQRATGSIFDAGSPAPASAPRSGGGASAPSAPPAPAESVPK
jgi:preprotein translocase subunit SecG